MKMVHKVTNNSQDLQKLLELLKGTGEQIQGEMAELANDQLDILTAVAVVEKRIAKMTSKLDLEADPQSGKKAGGKRNRKSGTTKRQPSKSGNTTSTKKAGRKPKGKKK